MKKCGLCWFPAVTLCETGSQTGKDGDKASQALCLSGSKNNGVSHRSSLPACAFSWFADARSWRAPRQPGCPRQRSTRTRTWAATGASTPRVEQTSTSHFSSRAALSSRKRYHPKHERSVPGTFAPAENPPLTGAEQRPPASDPFLGVTPVG